ncbi:VTT domain-containing protein (plasmid) [Cytobacillus spongiae]|uniref:DedA family protein n=1 Tax=Cytobacillus spongiae TaxID=2901381 RepID=UPI001F2C0865|nr:VTT domain-containing protein [Cytobacillus spongiae]UII58077.1 VTT domain-containing protein [Cytobacillus spongiae]
MFEFVISLIKDLGMWGLFAGNAIEASSLPFPGALVTLTYGYLLDPTWMELIVLATTSSLVYTVFSYIPYGIGHKLKDKIKEKTSSKKMEKGQKWFRKCGLWSIAITRPLGIGNYISYVAGISKVNKWKFGGLTFMGIFPITFTMLIVGKNGNLKNVQTLMNDIQTYVIVGVAVLAAGFFFVKFLIKPKENTGCLDKESTMAKQIE